MTITRETDYAIRCVLHLSKKQGHVTMVDEIAREMIIPKTFLAKIMQRLVKANLLRSFRGVKGGFQLTRKPEEISILDVIVAMQGPIAINRCAVDAALCGLKASCTVHPIWVELRRKTENYLRQATFGNLLSTMSLEPKHHEDPH